MQHKFLFIVGFFYSLFMLQYSGNFKNHAMTQTSLPAGRDAIPIAIGMITKDLLFENEFT